MLIIRFLFNISACGRLVRRAFALHELPSLIEVIFSSQDEGDTIRRLLGDDAQAFVDVIYEARPHPLITNLWQSKLAFTHLIKQVLDRPDISPGARKNCLKSLYRTCGRHALLPTSLKIPIAFERTGNTLFRGGFADVWKADHCGRDVAIKVIRIYSDSDLQRVIGVSSWPRSVPACLCADGVPCRDFARRLSHGGHSDIRTSCH